MTRSFFRAILAGISISIGCIVFLRVGGVAGAVLFSFGLLTVVHFQWPLYTGKAGFVHANKSDSLFLLLTLLGNIVGCALTAAYAAYALPALSDLAGNIVSARMDKGPVACMLLAIGCGFIMTAAVMFGRHKQFLPLLFGVPVFILCGFAHSIADAFYFLAQPAEGLTLGLLWVYLGEVLGNLIGCNLYRIIDPWADTTTPGMNQG